jgi:NADH:ubiquinone oxidoreductase subunit 4 (subunit M)
LLWLAFFASFAVKLPMWPVHTWLPDAHVQAPTAGSVILAGVLLKLGGYGFIRFSLPMFPEASAQLFWLVMGLSMVAIVYTSLVALVQKDMKKLIAYSSVAHMAFVSIGLFAFNRQGIEGALIVMLRTASSRARSSCASASSTIACTPARSSATAASATTCRSTPSCSCSSPWPRSACPAPAASSANS